MKLKTMPPEIMPRDGSLVYWETSLSEHYKSILITRGSWSDRKFVLNIRCDDAPGHHDEWTCVFHDPISVRIGERFFEASWNAKDCQIPKDNIRAPFYEIKHSKEHAHYEAWIERIFPNDQDLKEYLIASDQDEVRILTNHEPVFQKL